MDDEIVKAEGTSIPEIFKRGGEEEFRAIEHRLLEKFSKESGAVIAAGGGAVTREENYDLLRQNSCVIWLQRDIAKLPAEDRCRQEPISTRCTECAGRCIRLFRTIRRTITARWMKLLRAS